MKRIYKRWTIKDIEFARSNYPTFPKHAIAEALGVSITRLDAMMKRYKIARKMHQWNGGKSCIKCGVEFLNKGGTRNRYSFDGFKTYTRFAPPCKS